MHKATQVMTAKVYVTHYNHGVYWHMPKFSMAQLFQCTRIYGIEKFAVVLPTYKYSFQVFCQYEQSNQEQYTYKLWLVRYIKITNIMSAFRELVMG
jgi:hypothetical protein